jgi:copper resistance protein D
MALLLDVYGFISVVLRGLVLTTQAFTLGGLAFIVLLAQPFAELLGSSGAGICKRSYRMLGWSALALALVESVAVILETIILADSAGLSIKQAITANFALSGMIIALAAMAISLLAFSAEDSFNALFAILFAGAILLGQGITSHAVERLHDQTPLVIAELAHQAAASFWIGGIPYFLMALSKCRNGITWRLIGRRFSQISMASVLLLVSAGIYMAVAYIGSVDALYGTAYGIMVSTKALLLLGLLFLGGMNYRLVERLRRDPSTPILRLRRFAEVEIGVGLTVIFTAASLTSQPPGVDLVQDRASFHEIVERMTPTWPRLSSPSHASLAIPELQAKLDAEAAQNAKRPEAFTPGMGRTPPRNAFDIAWSEYNHHWAGLFVLAIGFLALAERSGYAPWARHWPLLFLGLAGFLFVRSDPETWPLGDIGLLESLRDPEVVQHRLLVLLTAGFSVVEWRGRLGRFRSAWPALVFPLVTALAGALLLAHSHALSNVKDQLLIEISHVPLALCGITAGWARWLELRLEPPESRIAAWVWPVCLVLVGLVLLSYREA